MARRYKERNPLKYGKTFKEIADVLHVSHQCVRICFIRGMKKIMSNPEGREFLRSSIALMKRQNNGIIKCVSVECLSDWIELYEEKEKA